MEAMEIILGLLLTWVTIDILGWIALCYAGVVYMFYSIPGLYPPDTSSTLSAGCDSRKCLHTFLIIAWEARSPPAGQELLLWAGSFRRWSCALSKQSRNQQKCSLLRTKLSRANSQLWNCSSRQLGSWFPQGDSRSSLPVKVSWFSVLTRPLVCSKEVLHQTHQSVRMHNYASAVCLPKHDNWNALMQGLFRSDQHQKFWTLGWIVTLITYSICSKPVISGTYSSSYFLGPPPERTLKALS